MARRSSPAIDMRSPEGRAGLRQRLAEKRRQAIGRTVLLPVYRVPQLPDRPKATSKEGGR